jgi:uncharacterized protein (TIGR02594 family)
MTTRREFVRSCSYSLAALIALESIPLDAQTQVPHLPTGIGVDADWNGPIPRQTLGDKRPLAPEELVARKIIAKAPSGPTPYDVAKYFLAVANGAYGVDWKPYTQGWPVRWNPVIVNFFQATKTKPEGDLTPWCAAFVNWCCLQGGHDRATSSASSGSFRCFGSQTAAPQEGDVVVFRELDSHDQCIGRGHVGFFVKDLGTEIEVLGGNQVDARHLNHRICSQRLRKDGQVLKLHSFRTGEGLHTQARINLKDNFSLSQTDSY